MYFRNDRLFPMICAMALCLAGCGTSGGAPVITPMVPTAAVEHTEPATAATVSPFDTETLTIVVTEEDIRQLEDYPNLKTLDLTGSDCYAAIARYRKFHPEVDISYTVSLGAAQVDVHSETLSLDSGELDFETLLENLQYLTDLKSLELKALSFDAGQIDRLREAYPKLALTYSVSILGEDHSPDVTELDLSGIRKDQVEETARQLSLLPELTAVNLMPANGGISQLGIPEVKLLVDAAPEANFHYTFQFYGRTISTDDEKVEFKKVHMGNEAEEEIRQVLDIMTGCSYFKLEDCGLDNEVLAGIRDDYPDIKIVWRIRFGKYSAMTDQETIRAVYNVFDDTCYNLRYCTDVKYMDIGHNETLTDLSFVGFMPDLEILIASGCTVKDLSGFENCKKLEFLELAYCSKLTDISPLAGCESLTALNISYTKVKDLSPLDGVPLERFMSIHTWVQPDEQKIFQEIHPDCWTTFYYGNQPYGKGWRYDDNGKTYSEIYKKVRKVFKYDDMPMPTIPKK